MVGKLHMTHPKRTLYLAIPDYVYENVFKHHLIQKTLKRYSINLILVDIKLKKIVSWIK
jgi:hypothetical protein